MSIRPPYALHVPRTNYNNLISKNDFKISKVESLMYEGNQSVPEKFQKIFKNVSNFKKKKKKLKMKKR